MPNMRNIVVIKYQRNSLQSHGAVHKEDASYACETEMDAEILRKWLRDNFIVAAQVSQEEWDKLPTEYPLDNAPNSVYV